jgi:hypothetical protein
MSALPPPASHRTASKLAQLLSQTLIDAQPHLAKEHHAEGYRQLEDFLEGLEAHTATKIGPFLREVFSGVEIPETLKPLIEDAIGPQAQFSAIVTQLFLYGTVSQVLSTSLQPFLQGVTNDLWVVAVDKGISVPVSPAVLATAGARGLELGGPPTVTLPDSAFTEAMKSGVSAADLQLQANIVGTPPSPQDLFELLRRGIIGPDQVKTGLREGDTRDDWIDAFAQLSHTWPSPLDFVRAAVQEQMSYGDAAAWAEKTGLDTTTSLPIDASDNGGSNDMFGLLWAVAGRPPGPQELATMTRRGIIQQNGSGAAATTFQQGIAESDVKTKWTDALFKLSEYLPPPEAISTLLEHGGITKAQAEAYWTARGVPDELTAAYVYTTEQQHVTQEKLLAKGVVATAYFDQILTHDEAMAYLEQLGYTGQIAETMLAVQDFRRDMTALNGVVRRVSTLYTANKLSPADAKAALVQVGITADQADSILSTWEAVRERPVHLPSVSEIGGAVKYGTITIPEALDELAALGYQGRDAQIVLSAHAETQVTPLSPSGTGVGG